MLPLPVGDLLYVDVCFLRNIPFCGNRIFHYTKMLPQKPLEELLRQLLHL